MNALDAYVYKIRNALEREISSKLCLHDKKDINSAITRAQNLVDDGNNKLDDIAMFD
ncbi:hypothetical protein AAZX31_18G198200 [Glycine max]